MVMKGYGFETELELLSIAQNVIAKVNEAGGSRCEWSVLTTSDASELIARNRPEILGSPVVYETPSADAADAIVQLLQVIGFQTRQPSPVRGGRFIVCYRNQWLLREVLRSAP